MLFGVAVPPLIIHWHEDRLYGEVFFAIYLKCILHTQSMV